jgi:DNA-binding transcriptional MocR family regulator
MLTIGMDRDEIWPVIRKVAFDSLPEARSRIIRVLQDAGDQLPNLYELATASGCSASTTRRHLEDLDHYGAISRQKANPSRGDEYRLSEWAQKKLVAISAVPENSHPHNDSDSGKPHSAFVAGGHATLTRSSNDQSDISETSRPEIARALGKSGG